MADLSLQVGLLSSSVPARSGGLHYACARRGLDLLLGTALALLALPVFLAAMIAVGLSGPGPVIFTQRRIGLRGRPFAMFKLRTMYHGAEDDRQALQLLNELDGPVFKIKVDPRITPVGRWLRRFSIDELPQLLNVIAGQMSLVGPRPLPAEETRIDTPAERLRLSVKPGLTCLWQIAGRNEIPYREWIQLDCLYVEHRCLALDLRILARTPLVVLSGRGAY